MKIVIRISLQICFMLLLSIGLVNAQVKKPYNNLIITEALTVSTPDNYVEFTNMGTETIDLSQFEFGKITPWNDAYRPDATSFFRLPKKNLAPGKSYLIATAQIFGPKMWLKDPVHYLERITKPEFFKLADQLLYVREPNSTANDTVTPYYSTMDAWNGRECWYLRHHFINDVGAKDSVVVDQVGGVFDQTGGRNKDGSYNVAGVLNATGNSVLIRKASVKTGNTDFAHGRGLDFANSEWIPVPYLSFWNWRAVFWTVGNQAIGAVLDVNTLVSKTGKVTVDIANGTITVPWGIRRNDSIMYQFYRKPGLAWAYSLVPNAEDSAFLTIRTGDKLTLYVCGDQPTVKDFTLTALPPTASDNIVIPKVAMNYITMHYPAKLPGSFGYRVSDGVVGMDTIRFVPFATRVDTLFKYLEKAPKASWQISYKDGVVRPDLISGDKLQVTSEDGKLKEYYLKLQKYTPSADDYLSSITWPDMPSWFKGVESKSFGWVGDTIPGFIYTKNNYVVKIPMEYDGIPALVFSKRQLNSRVAVIRAKTLTGSPEDRTVTFTVTAENNTTVNVYTVRFEKEKNPVNIQPWKGEPFISQIVFRDQWVSPWIEICNPGTQIVDLSNYMIFCNYLGPIEAFNTNNQNTDSYASAPWRKYVPGKKWQDAAKWSVQARILEPDLAVNAIVQPGDVFVMTDHANGGSLNIYGNEVDVNFATGRNPWGYTMPSENAISEWMGTTYYFYKILNDSVVKGLKPATDINDFQLLEVFGGGDGVNWVVGGKQINQLTAYTRKPTVYKGNPVLKGSWGTNWDDSEWTMKDDAYFNKLGYGWPLNIYSIVGGIGSHIMDEVTITKSTVTSKVYKVSPGYSQKETIKGLTTGTTVSGFYNNILKANALQTLKVKSATSGAVLTEADAISNGDTLIVLSADNINTSKYILDVTTTGLSSNAVLTSTNYDIIITGSTGKIKKIPQRALLKDVLAHVTVPAGATLTITDATDAYMPLTKLNYSNTYVDVFATTQIYFEVIAENGTTKILYNLNPYENATDVTSDVYSVDRFASLIQFVPEGTSVASLLGNVTPARLATMMIIDKAGFIRETGDVYRDDKLVVTAADGTTKRVYYLSILNNKVNTYLAYITSDVYQVDQVKHIITGPKINTTNSEFMAKLYPSFGATLEVLDLDANGALNLYDKLLVTSADGSTKTTYEINDPSILLFSLIGSAFYKNDGVILANWDYDIDLTYLGTSATGSVYRISKQVLLQGGEFKIRKDHQWNESYGYKEVAILGDPTNFVDAITYPNIKVLAQKTYEISFIVDWANNTYTLSFNTINTLSPTITTTVVTAISSNSAVCGGEIVNQGSSSVTARGVCWSTTANPTATLSTKTTNGTGSGAFASNITGLTAETTYHVRAYATNSEGTGYGEDLTFVTTASNPTQHFVPVWTGNGFDHMNINIYSAKLDGVELETGDEIGIFDGTICVGAGILTGTITQTSTFDIAVSRNDGSGNGYTSGNAITFKLFDKSGNLEMTNVTADYSNTDPSWSTDGKFAIGVTAFAELNGFTKVNQNIALNTGWNIISANVIPSNLNLKDIFQSLIDAGKLKKVMDEAGKTIENFGAFGGWKNNIGNLNSAKGYKVNVTVTSTLSLEGTPVPLPFDLALATGWNIISYPSATAQDAKALVQSLIDAGKLKKVMDEAGKTIENFGAFGGWKNNIGNLLPGKGYKVNVLENCTLTIPANGTKAATIVPEVLASTHFTKAFTGNGTDHMNIHLVNLQASGLQEGDEIGIYDGKLCVGAQMIGQEDMLSGVISIPASACDETGIKTNGFTTGQPIALKLFRFNREYTLKTVTLQNSPTSFVKSESLFVQVSIGQTTEIAENGNQASVSCYPNPFNDQLTIEIQLPEAGKLDVTIYDSGGKLVRKLYIGQAEKAGKLVWDGRNGRGVRMVPGTYILKVNNWVEKIILKK